MLQRLLTRAPLLAGLLVSGVVFTIATRAEAGQNPPPTIFSGSDTVVYVDSDAVGSGRMLTDANGAVVTRHDYQPFGALLWDSDALQTSLAFALTARDTDTAGQDYAGARYFEANLGRFRSVDPGHVAGNLYDPQSWNGYVYGQNNPLRFIDPSGMQAQGPVVVPRPPRIDPDFLPGFLRDVQNFRNGWRWWPAGSPGTDIHLPSRGTDIYLPRNSPCTLEAPKGKFTKGGSDVYAYFDPSIVERSEVLSFVMTRQLRPADQLWILRRANPLKTLKHGFPMLLL